MDQPYIVSARKYRPSTFRSVVGQKSLTATLKNAIDSNRLAQAYLFCGPRGVGKTSCARIFAKTINCLSKTPEGESCNECESCSAFNEGRSMNIVELDAASNNSVDAMRQLMDQVRIPPQTGRYKVFIIDEVHMLSTAAFNAFLKTLEEPPAYVVFILATTEKHKVIPTILSRCQIYDFSRITVNDMVEHMQYVASCEGIETEPEALNVIAQKADGGMRDALSIFDQVAASSLGKVTYRSAIENLNVLDYEYYFRLVDAFLAGDVQKALLIYKEVRDSGFDSLFFINGLGAHIRDLMVAANPPTAVLLEVSRDVAQRYVEQAVRIPARWYYTAMEYVNYCDLNYRTATSKQFIVELTLIRLCNILSRDNAPIDASKLPESASIETKGAPASSATPPPAASATPAPKKPTSSAAEPSSTPQNSPAPAPKPAAPAPTARKAATTRPMHRTVRINGSADGKAGDGSKDEADSHPQARRNKFTAQQLAEAWEAYRQAHSDKTILVNTMRAAQPQAIEGDAETYRVVVDNPAQKEEIEDNLQDLLGFLRSKVDNDFLKIQLDLSAPDARPTILTDSELLKEMVEENPLLGDILTEFDTQLAR